VAVIVDKARRDSLASGVDGLARRPGELADGIPEPSTIRPFLINKSYAIGVPPL
jgi:hypothetical protein